MCSGTPIFTKLILAYSKCMGTVQTKFCTDGMKITEDTPKYLWLPSVKYVFPNTDFHELIRADSKCIGTFHTTFCSDRMKITEVTPKHLWLPSVKYVFRNTDFHETHTSWFKVYGYLSYQILFGPDENYRSYAKLSLTSYSKVCDPEYRCSRNSY
jgi:hypothetical protein